MTGVSKVDWARDLDRAFRFSGPDGLTNNQLKRLLGIRESRLRCVMKRDGRFTFFPKQSGLTKGRWKPKQ